MIRKILVVGGGVAGMSTAISMRRRGFAVDLVEIDPAWKVYGAGITVTSPTLRALDRLGLLNQVIEQGATWMVGYLYSPDGALVGEVRWPPFAAGKPAAGGIMRPALHRVFSAATRAASVNVSLGVSVTALELRSPQVRVEFSNGQRGDYDLVVGADGIQSRTRGMLFPEAPKPLFTGQAVYRIVVERLPGIDSTHFLPRGDSMLGCSLVSNTHMYVFLLLPMPGNPWMALEAQPQHLYDAMAGWGGFVPAVRTQVLTSPVKETINYRPLEAMVLPKPWHRGRVVLIGDAAHATTPHMASGAGMAIEDGMVLAEELGRDGALDSDTDLDIALARFTARRFERCRTVVENSVLLGEMEMRGDSLEEHNRVVEETIAALMAEP